MFKIFPQYILLQKVEPEFRYSCSIFGREEIFQSQFNHIFFHNIIVFVILNKNFTILVQYFEEKEEIYVWIAISHFTYFTLGFDQPIHHQQRLILLHFTYMVGMGWDKLAGTGVIFKFWGSMWRVKTNSKFKNSFFLFLYIGMTIEFTWVFQIQDLVPPLSLSPNLKLSITHPLTDRGNC